MLMLGRELQNFELETMKQQQNKSKGNLSPSGIHDMVVMKFPCFYCISVQMEAVLYGTC